MVRGKKPKLIRDKLKEKIIRNIWTFFETEEEKEERKEKNHNGNIIKDRKLEISRHFLNKKKIIMSLKQ